MQGPFRRSVNTRQARSSESLQRPIAAGLKLDPAHNQQIDLSHERCAELGLSRIAAPDHSTGSRSELALQRERSLRLHLHAAPVMELLHEQIRNTHSMVALTDASGTILLSIGDDDFLSRASRVALAPGANWSEAAKGTNAVGTALISELPTLVHADEHFLHANHFLTCSAAPILDPRGQVLGVLDVSGDHRSYHQHTMALVKMSARMIENHWLSDDCRHGLRLHFHSRVEYIGTLMEGILALDAEGRITGANRGALEQLGLSGAALRQLSLRTLFDLPLDALIDRFRSPLSLPLAVHTDDGRQFHLHARFNGPMWAPLVKADAPVQHVSAAHAEPANQPVNSPDQAADAASSALQSLCCGDPAVDRLIGKLQRVARASIPVLLIGELGSGKAALARALHQDSPRSAQPFVALHCGTTPADQLQATLQQGLTQTRQGTLFIDDVDTLPLTLQAMLMHDLRQQARALVCATRQDLAVAVQEQRFREDLLYQLQGLSLQLPPLRERSDLPALAQRLLAQLAPQREWHIDDAALVLLRRHAWPGNVRELKSVLRTAVTLAGNESLLSSAHWPDALLAACTSNAEEAPATVGANSDDKASAIASNGTPVLHDGSLESQQLAAIQRAVAQAGGNISAAARALGISRNTLYRKLGLRANG